MRIMLAVITVAALAGFWSAAPAAVSVSVSPDTLDFGEMRVGETDSLSFTLTNTGSDSLIETLVARPSSYVKISFDPASVSLGPGDSINVKMLVSPLTGFLSIYSHVFSAVDGFDIIILKDIIGPAYIIKSVFSGLYWQPFQLNRSLYEDTLYISVDRVTGIQSAPLRP